MSRDEFNAAFLQLVRSALPNVPPENVVGSAMLFDGLGLTSTGLVLLAAEFESIFERVLPVETLPLAWICPLDEWTQKIYSACYATDESTL
ncbi:MAG: hypothetical protein ACJ8KA_07755 [Sulfurifustis sp.]